MNTYYYGPSACKTPSFKIGQILRGMSWELDKDGFFTINGYPVFNVFQLNEHTGDIKYVKGSLNGKSEILNGYINIGE